MPALLRIGVDRAYESRVLHYARVNQELFPALDSLRYLESCKEVVKDLNERGIKASLFFQPFTVPNKEFAQELVKEGHSIGLHAVHTRDYKDFLWDLNKISKRLDACRCKEQLHKEIKTIKRQKLYLYVQVKSKQGNREKLITVGEEKCLK